MIDYANLYNVDEYGDDYADLHYQAAHSSHSLAHRVVRARVSRHSLKMIWHRVNDKIKDGVTSGMVSHHFSHSVLSGIAEAVKYAAIDQSHGATQLSFDSAYAMAKEALYNKGFPGLLEHINSVGRAVAKVAATDWR